MFVPYRNDRKYVQVFRCLYRFIFQYMTIMSAHRTKSCGTRNACDFKFRRFFSSILKLKFSKKTNVPCAGIQIQRTDKQSLPWDNRLPYGFSTKQLIKYSTLCTYGTRYINYTSSLGTSFRPHLLGHSMGNFGHAFQCSICCSCLISFLQNSQEMLRFWQSVFICCSWKRRSNKTPQPFGHWTGA